MNELITVDKMTSMEIAEITGKQHQHVMRDIRDEVEKLSSAGVETESKFGLSERSDSTGRNIPYYELSKEGVLQLAARYDAVVRAKLIDMVTKQKPQLDTSLLSPQMQLFNQMYQALAVNEIELKKVSTMALEAKTGLELAKESIHNVENKLNKSIEILTEKVEKDWRETVNSKINEMCARCGFNYQTFRATLYEELEGICKCDLSARQKRMRERMAKSGATYKERNGITKIHVIEADVKLKQIFETIVSKYVLKYAE